MPILRIQMFSWFSTQKPYEQNSSNVLTSIKSMLQICCELSWLFLKFATINAVKMFNLNAIQKIKTRVANILHNELEQKLTPRETSHVRSGVFFGFLKIFNRINHLFQICCLDCFADFSNKTWCRTIRVYLLW